MSFARRASSSFPCPPPRPWRRFPRGAHARRGRYELLTLARRVMDRPLATVRTVDMRDEYAEVGPDQIVSRALGEAVAARLARREQVLILLNRRGFSTSVFCRQCGATMECPSCSVSLVVHGRGRAVCHYCNFARAVPRTCEHCGGPFLELLGYGTERVEAELRRLFPEARVARLDRDTARRRGAVPETLARFGAGDLDVLVGTQMIAKGHDFQRVSLVVVLNPDGQLASHDFRAPERLFSTLVQVAGRAGRGGHASRVLLQTRFPQHPLFAALARHDYAAFADSQLAERRSANMPPFTYQALLTAEARTMEAALRFLREARDDAPATDTVRVFDPVPMALQRLAGVERAQLLVEADRRAPLQAFLRTWLDGLRAKKSRLRWQIEVDPQEI